MAIQNLRQYGYNEQQIQFVPLTDTKLTPALPTSPPLEYNHFMTIILHSDITPPPRDGGFNAVIDIPDPSFFLDNHDKDQVKCWKQLPDPKGCILISWGRTIPNAEAASKIKSILASKTHLSINQIQVGPLSYQITL